MKHIIGSLVLALASVLMVGANAQKAPALLDINAATEAQINGLPGVSNKIANAIFKNRPYANLDDLNNKVRLSKKTLDKIRNLVSFNADKPAGAVLSKTGVPASAPTSGAVTAAVTAVAGAAIANNSTTGNSAAGNTTNKSAKASANTATTANPVNVNTASREELMTIPEVGPKLADAIVANRPYKDMAEMVKKVKGIGPKNSIKLAPFMRF